MYINKTEICKYKKNDNIIYNLCLGRVLKNFTKDEQSGISLNGTCTIFQLTIVQLKEDVLNIHKYLTVKNNKK